MTRLRSTRHPCDSQKKRCPPCRTCSTASNAWPTAMHDCRDFRVGVFDGIEDIGPAFPVGDRLRHVGAPHFIGLVGDVRSIVRLGLGASNAMRREQAVLPHHPSHTAGARANPSKAQSRP